MRVFVLIVVCMLRLPAAAEAQCCSPGNPIGGTGNVGVLPGGVAKLIVNYGYSYSGKYLDGSRSVEPVFVEAGYFNHASAGVSVGISSRWTVDAEATYFINKVQQHVEGVLPERRYGSGIGDVSFVVNYRLFGGGFRWWEVTTGAGLKMPAGTHRQTSGGALLPLDVQPTSGAFDFIHTVFLHRGIPERRIRFFLANRIEMKNANSDGYRYGNLYATSFFASYNLNPRWDAMLQLRSEIRARDVRPAGKIPVTGSRKLFAAPQLSYSPNQTLTWTLVAALPLYQHYNREQLANSFSVSAAVMKKFIVGSGSR